ncbi:MAG: RluA family pseudouridine synthase [Bacteroidales bacterium]|nr:RluA family pseudouridine synthase [Bacteroidales bacterium]MCF8402798.1 RluA family pseudouridine synthase [Bacteroidales bacterium]
MEDLNLNQDEDQEMYEHFRFEVDKGQGLLRIDKFLMSRIENASRSKIQAAASAGNILVNNERVRSSYKVKPMDVISIVMDQPLREIELISEDIPLEVCYEDSDLIIINKPAGMVVHPAYGNYTGTLVNALIYHFNKSKGKKTGNSAGPYLVHRIDKNTSGLIIVAKNEVAQAKLQQQFAAHSIERKYIALVWGDVKNETGTVTGNIGRSLSNRKVFRVFIDGDRGKHAVTHYKVIERFGYVTKVECQLETGRTHQIRVHLRYIGYPLFNDETYGGARILRGTTFSKYKQFVENCFKICPRQALHAQTLGFIHPTTNENLRFESNLSPDFAELLEKWRHYAIHKLSEEK